MGLESMFLTNGRGTYPDGGNQLDADGSVHWAKIETMDACTSEGGAGSGIWDFIYQANLARDLQAAGAPVSFINQIKGGLLSPAPSARPELAPLTGQNFILAPPAGLRTIS